MAGDDRDSSSLPGKPPEEARPLSVTQIADYEIVRRLGAGGMAEVFLAKKRGAEGTYKVVVVKRILPGYTTSRRFRSMFIDEAQLATRLNHPNVVQVYEFSNEGDQGHVLAMEYVEGCDLGRLMSEAKAKGVRIPPWVAAWIVSEAAKGLHYAHEKRDEGGAPLDIVHRDVSPQNVLLSFDGVVKIADFGIASARFSDHEEGVLKGKFGYMSPEQARGEKVDRRSDLYSLGVIFWECLTGHQLHEGLEGEALLEKVREGKIDLPSSLAGGVPRDLEEIVVKLLAPNRDDRFAKARDVSAAIGRAMMTNQELVDGGSLEAVVTELVDRDETTTIVRRKEDANARNNTQAAAPIALSADDPWKSPTGGDPRKSPTGDDGSRPPKRDDASIVPHPTRGPEAREVRHVAIVTLRLRLRDSLAAGELKSTARVVERARGMLGDMAYKRGARWNWSGDFEARAIIGLGPKSAKAASDAAALAVETHEAIEAINEDLPFPIAASISIVRGIASGSRDQEGNLFRHVLHEPATYLADVLAKATPERATWVAGGVYRLVRREFRWGDAPTLDLKKEGAAVQNVPPTMRIYVLERTLSREERALQQGAAQSDLVGRDVEKAELFSAYHALVNGGARGSLVIRAVVGELGIGKTALVTTFLSELPPIVRVVRVECTPVRMEVPYSALAELLHHALGARGDESYDEVLALLLRDVGPQSNAETTRPMFARLAEIAANQSLGGDEEDALYRKKLLLSGMRHLLLSMTRKSPLVVVIDGLQWADTPTLDLFAELLKTPDPFPVFFVLVTRPDDRVAALLEGRFRIELVGLSSEEQIRLVATRLGVSEGVGQVCAELMPRVGGNPFYLLELVDALLERGLLEIQEDSLVKSTFADFETIGLPSTLEQLLADRIQELPGAERVMVDWLALAGGPLGLADIMHLNERVAMQRGGPATFGSSQRANENVAMRLVERGLCDRKGDVLDFRHPLTRDAAYASLNGTTRSRMHLALGEHLAATSLARGLSAAIVARHLVRGEAPERASDLYLEAANAARNAYQAQLAIRYYLRAAQYLESNDPRLLTIHESLEALYRVLGRRRERMKHLGALRRVARANATPKAACLALLRTARYDFDEGRLSHGLPVAEKAAALAHAIGSPSFEIEAEMLVSEFSREVGEVHNALAASDRALAACNPSVNRVPARMRADVLATRGVLLRRVGRVRESVDAYAEAIAISRKVGARRQEARAKNALAYAMFVQGRYEDAIAVGLESIRIDVSIGGRFQLAKTLTNIGHAYARLGDMERAKAYLKRARDTHERYRDKDGHTETLLVSAEVLLELGEVEAAEAFLAEGVSLSATTGNAYDKAHASIVTAAIARVRRDAPTALEHAISGRRNAERQSLVSYHFYALAIEAAARVDEGEVHAATLLATTALGAVEALQGCEYGLEIRVLCADALKRAASPEAPLARQRAVDYATALSATIRDPRLRNFFGARPLVAGLFDNTPMPKAIETGEAAGTRPLPPSRAKL